MKGNTGEGSTTKEYTTDTWLSAIIDINREVRKLKQRLVDMEIEPKANYLDEWNELFAAISDESAEDYNLTYDKVTKYMFGNPTTLEDFITEALRMVPPVKIMTEI